MPLRVYTARVSYAGPDALDISRSGADHPRPGVETASWLAPSWSILRPALDARQLVSQALRSGRHELAVRLDQEAWAVYEPRYLAEMHRAAWEGLLIREERTLLCYCAPGPDGVLRCHRRLAAGILVKLGALDMGER